MISFEHHKVLIRWDGVFTPLKMEKLRPRELKFLVVHHWMSKEKTSDSSSGLLMLYPALFQQRHIELSLIQPPGGWVGWHLDGMGGFGSWELGVTLSSLQIRPTGCSAMPCSR